jgi:protein Mpv17
VRIEEKSCSETLGAAFCALCMKETVNVQSVIFDAKLLARLQLQLALCIRCERRLASQHKRALPLPMYHAVSCTYAEAHTICSCALCLISVDPVVVNTRREHLVERSQSNVQGWLPWAAAAITSATMSAAGDGAAQTLVKWELEREKKPSIPLDFERTMRMFTFGLSFYGPFQHWWYGAIAKQFPGVAVKSFLSKVILNQVVLGPIVLTTAFAWNLWLRGLGHELPDKLNKDLVPTMLNGWKFWVPAACVNFYIVPLQFQVLYMSVCGVIWTAYVSFASHNSANAIVDTAKDSKAKQ